MRSGFLCIMNLMGAGSQEQLLLGQDRAGSHLANLDHSMQLSVKNASKTLTKSHLTHQNVSKSDPVKFFPMTARELFLLVLCCKKFGLTYFLSSLKTVPNSACFSLSSFILWHYTLGSEIAI